MNGKRMLKHSAGLRHRCRVPGILVLWATICSSLVWPAVLEASPQELPLRTRERNLAEEVRSQNQQQTTTPDDPAIEILASGLPSPMALALRPQSSAVFISLQSSSIVMVDPSAESKDPKTVIDGFASLPADADSQGAFGTPPLGLGFINPDTLVVGGVGGGGGADRVLARSFDLSTPATWPLNASSELLEVKHRRSSAAKAAAQAIYIAGKSVVLSSLNEQNQPLLLKTEYKAEKFSTAADFLTLELAMPTDAPLALGGSGRGEILLAADAGIDSELHVYFQQRRQIFGQVHCCRTVRESPMLPAAPITTGTLCVLRRAPTAGDCIGSNSARVPSLLKPTRAQKLTATRMFELEFPIAMEFSQQGELFIVSAGESADQGNLYRVTGLSSAGSK